MKMLLRLILISSWLLTGAEVTGQHDSIFVDLEVSILTCKSGDMLYSTFGHTGLRIRNIKNKSDIVYGYGTFNTETPYFYIKFLQGKLPYRLSATTMERFLREYDYFERSVVEQKLDLTTSQKKQLFKAMAVNMRPENIEYSYDFFFDNCTTRTIDKIAEVDKSLVYEKEIVEITFREMLKQNLQSMPWTEFGIDLIIGAVADQQTDRGDQHFLPMYLHDDLNGATVLRDGKRISLAKSDYLVLDFEAQERERKDPSPNYPLILGILLLVLEVLILWLKPVNKSFTIYTQLWMYLMAVMGVVMAFMWFGTDHLATKINYNLLWANVLFLPYMLLTGSKIRRAIAIVISILCLLVVANTLVQFLPQYFHPAFACFALINILMLYRVEKRTISI